MDSSCLSTFIGCCLFPLGLVVTTVLVLEAILAERHGHVLAVTVIAGVATLSLLTSIIASQVLAIPTENVNPAVDWQKMALEKRVSELQYRPETGLVAITGGGEVKITGIVPCCVRDGELARSQPSQVEVTAVPYVELPLPPEPVRQQISFNVFYPVEADAVAVSSFVVNEEGEVWCTERFFQAGLSGAAALGMAGFFDLYAATIVFVTSFVVILAFVVVGLEIYRWWQRAKKSD